MSYKMEHGIWFAMIDGKLQIVKCVDNIPEDGETGGLFFLFSKDRGMALHRSQLVSGPYSVEDLLSYVVPLGQLARMNFNMSNFLGRLMDIKTDEGS